MLNYVGRMFFGEDPSPQVKDGYWPASDPVLAATGGEHLTTQHLEQDDDWVLVSKDHEKENSNTHRLSNKDFPPGHQHWPHHGQDSNSASDTDPLEHLDEASSLIEGIDFSLAGKEKLNRESIMGGLSEKFLAYGGGDCSSDEDEGSTNGDPGMRPSSPESVFSTCSGRSHATYRARGRASEPWVMAPAPCFMLDPIADSPQSPSHFNPIENLLIEHPSMSVYQTLGYAHHDTRFPVATAGPMDVIRDAGLEQQQQEDSTQEAAMRGTPSRALHSIRPHDINLPEQLVKKANAAQRVEHQQSQQNISSRKCKHQNNVQHLTPNTKGKNRRNKCLNPSGFKSSRVSQRQ